MSSGPEHGERLHEVLAAAQSTAHWPIRGHALRSQFLTPAAVCRYGAPREDRPLREAILLGVRYYAGWALRCSASVQSRWVGSPRSDATGTMKRIRASIGG
jgi:hypothetical protein